MVSNQQRLMSKGYMHGFKKQLHLQSHRSHDGPLRFNGYREKTCSID